MTAAAIFISRNHRIRKVDTSGIITTVVGSGATGPGKGAFSGDNGAAINAQLNTPWGIAFDSSGNLYIADSENQRIRKVTFALACITQAQLDQKISEAVSTATASMYTKTQLDQSVKAEQLKWDANGDGNIGLEDIIRMLQVLAGLRP